MKNILLISRKYTDNLGDIAIGESMKYLITERGHNVFHLEYSTFGNDISSFSYNDKQSDKSLLKKALIRIFNMIPKKLIWYLRSGCRLIFDLKKIPYKNISCIIIGGGQLINPYPYDNQFAYAFSFWSFINKHILRTKLVLFSVGAGDKFSRYSFRAFQKGLLEVDSIYIRDCYSQKILADMLGILDCNYVPDTAFLYARIIPEKKEKRRIALIGIYDYLTYVKINNLELNRDEYYEDWLAEILRIESAGYEVKLFYSTGQDKIETERFAKYLNYQYEIVESLTIQDMIDNLAFAEYVYSGRMHSLILALVYGCKIKTFYTNKKLAIFDEMYNNKKINIQELERLIYENFDSAC